MRPQAKLQAANQAKADQRLSAKKQNLLASKELVFQRTQRLLVAPHEIVIVKQERNLALD
jgi:hypothetical protein